MFLIIPAIEVKDGKLYREIRPLDGEGEKLYPHDPISLAKLWRIENSKSIHLTFLGEEINEQNKEIIRGVCSAVDTPIELAADPHSVEEAKKLFDLGIYRLAISFKHHHDVLAAMVKKFSPRKIVARLKAEYFYHDIDQIDEQARKLRSLGFQRILYTDVRFDEKGNVSHPNIQTIETIAKHIKIPITVSGGVSNFEDLKALESLQAIGVDSAIIGRALYENVFCCQKLWRVVEEGKKL